MRSLRQMIHLMDDLERLFMSPTFARQSLLPYETPTWNNNLDRLERYAKPAKDDFKLSIDVKQFKPEELKVKVVDDCVVVEGKQESLGDDKKYCSHQFVRRYALPKDCDVGKVMSTLTPDGVLTVSVSKPQLIENHIEIKQLDSKPQESLKSDATTNDGGSSKEH